MKFDAMIRPTTLALVVGLLAGRPSLALADSPPSRSEDQPPGSVTHQPRLRVQILAGAGLGQFTSADTRRMAETAATWQLRSVFSTRTPLGAELAYVGSWQQLRLADSVATADLHGHGAEVALRVQAPLINGELRLAPFAFAGLGWTRYHLGPRPWSDSGRSRPSIEPLSPPVTSLKDGRRLPAADWSARSSDPQDDDVLTVPVGAGLALGYHRLLLDARLTVRPTLAEDRLLAALDRSSDLATWSAAISLGYQL